MGERQVCFYTGGKLPATALQMFEIVLQVYSAQSLLVSLSDLPSNRIAMLPYMETYKNAGLLEALLKSANKLYLMFVKHFCVSMTVCYMTSCKREY